MIPEEIRGPQPGGSDISCDSPFLRTSVIKYKTMLVILHTFYSLHMLIVL